MIYTFHKNNDFSNKFTKTTEEIIREFLQTKESLLEMPFEKLMLSFMTENYGLIDRITNEQWGDLFTTYRLLKYNLNVLQERIINYLKVEYSDKDAREQIKNAKIDIVEVVKVTYDNGVKEVLQVKGNKVIKFV